MEFAECINVDCEDARRQSKFYRQDISSAFCRIHNIMHVNYVQLIQVANWKPQL